MKTFISACLLLLMLPAAECAAHEGHARHQKGTLALSVAFDAQHRLWRAAVKAGRVVVDVSADQGKTFSPPVPVNPQPEKIGADGELRPKIALGSKGEIYVTWTQALDQPYAGHIKFSRSLDGGKSFSIPVIVNRNTDPITHRFESLAVADDGTIYIAWIDKRDLLAAKAAGRKYDGAAIYVAVSGDGAASFGVEYKVADGSCECCRIGLATEPGGTAVIFWRHVFDGSIRDHAVARIGPRGVLKEPVRATFGNWKIDACPHHGPAIARGGDWGWHLAWYDGNEKKPGLYVARLDGEAWVTSPARRFGNSDAQAGHPALFAMGEQLFLAWKEMTDTSAVIMAMVSEDGGRSWGTPRKLAETSGAADNPFLISDGKQVYLSWNTRQDGYRLIGMRAAK